MYKFYSIYADNYKINTQDCQERKNNTPSHILLLYVKKHL